ACAEPPTDAMLQIDAVQPKGDATRKIAVKFAHIPMASCPAPTLQGRPLATHGSKARLRTPFIDADVLPVVRRCVIRAFMKRRAAGFLSPYRKRRPNRIRRPHDADSRQPTCIGRGWRKLRRSPVELGIRRADDRKPSESNGNRPLFN